MLPAGSIAQFNYDYNWYTGNGYLLQDPLKDINRLTFKNKQLKISLDTLPIEFDGQNITFSDREGNLLFYSNGCELRSKDHNLIEGSDPLLPGSDDESYCTPPHAAMVSPESMLCIPFELNNDSTYYYIYQERDTVMKIDGNDELFGQFKEHLLLQSGDNLKLIYKDSTLSTKYNYIGFTEAIKHNNNKDWWLIYPLFRDTNAQFEAVKVNKNGAVGIDSNVQSYYSNPISNKGRASGQLTASLNGTKIALFKEDNELITFSFNRSTGVIILETRDTMSWVKRWPFTPTRGLCYSPNGRYLYAGVDSVLYQIDTQSPDFPFDTVRLAQSSETNFSLMQMGPDCKIYISIFPGGDAYHVIHRPNEKGKDCMPEVKGAKFPTQYRFTIPLFLNYRLGTTEENWCDSIFDDTTSSNFQFRDKQKHWQIWPNPTDGYLRIGHEDGNFGLESVDIYTFQGQKIQQQSFDALNVTYEMDVSNLPKGIYLVKIKPRIGREEWHRVVVF